ncbi:MAG: LarC family nickel insertion protein [Planctomycetota bacterium]|nr:LarC family nickel insertion protein [Planctomycetota bacterium]
MPRPEEGKAHGVKPDECHFHEVGGSDFIADICCFAWLLERLRNKGLHELYCMPIGCGQGTVSGSHGVMSNPAPATLEVLSASGLTLVQRETQQELVTPTAAAILACYCQPLPPNFSFSLETVIRSAGTREWTDIPSYLETRLAKFVLTPRDRVTVLQCNVDDMTGEELEDLTDSLVSAGALDAWIENTHAKKGRPAYKICVLAHPASAAQFSKMLCKLTTTIGVRYHEVDRFTLPRRTVVVKTDLGDVRVKLSGEHDEAIKPEMADVKRIAQEKGLPLVQARRSIEAQVRSNLNS